jgi:hypothetical protein
MIDSALTESGIVTKIQDTADRHVYYVGDMAPTPPRDELGQRHADDAFILINCPPWAELPDLGTMPNFGIGSYVSRVVPNPEASGTPRE